MTSLLISHVTESLEVVWFFFFQWCYTMLSFQSSFGTRFFEVVLCSAVDLVSVLSLTPVMVNSSSQKSHLTGG